MTHEADEEVAAPVENSAPSSLRDECRTLRNSLVAMGLLRQDEPDFKALPDDAVGFPDAAAERLLRRLYQRLKAAGGA